MSLRKEVFQSKVLKRLYPSAHEQNTSPPASAAERLQPLPHKQTRNNRIAVVQGSIPKKVYTALPPPEDFSITCENDCLPASNPDPTDSGGSSNSDGQESQKRRRRRRKRKVITSISTAETTPCSQSDAPNTSKSASMDCLQSTEKLSKNRKRKLKKKRHKEKILALGLIPHTQALEFTYSQTGEEEEDSEELFHFLRSTHEMYISKVSDVPYSLTAVPTLFSCLSDGTLPSAEISRLCELKTLLTEMKESLQTLLDEYRNTSVLTSNEVSVVCSLLEYWFNEILPMQRPQVRCGAEDTAGVIVAS